MGERRKRPEGPSPRGLFLTIVAGLATSLRVGVSYKRASDAAHRESRERTARLRPGAECPGRDGGFSGSGGARRIPASQALCDQRRVLMARFSEEMVTEVVQRFWAAMQRGEFITDAAAEAGTYRKKGARWLGRGRRRAAASWSGSEGPLPDVL